MIVVASRKGRENNGTLKGYKGVFTQCEKSTLSSNQTNVHPGLTATTLKTPTKFPATALSQAIFGCA